MNPVARILWRASERARARRAEIFRNNFQIDAATKILDLGSEDGANIAGILKNTEVSSQNVFIADIDAISIERGHAEYKFNPVLLDETGNLPFADEFFDIVYCSSVIEHVTVPKEDVWNAETDFESIAAQNQQKFAEEIQRVGKRYFVQTPAKHFPIESHSWLPLIGFLPRSAMISALQFSNSYWIKQTIPDFYLLDESEMRRLFPGAIIVREKKFGLIKSIMAIKN